MGKLNDAFRADVGDRGQRYEVSYFDPDANERKVFGWSDMIEGAQAMSASIEAHPAWQFAQILDRQCAK